MRQKRWLSVLAGILLFRAPGAVLAAEPSSVEEITACVAKNAPATSAVQTIEMKSTDRLGGTRTLGAKIYWKVSEEGFDQTLVEVENPPDVRGSSYLILGREGGNQAFSYLPEYRRVRRIQASAMGDSLFGTDLTYEDFEHLQAAATDPEAQRLEDVTISERTAAVLSATPTIEGSAYSKLVSFVDQETCAILKMEFYDLSDELVKTLDVDPASIAKKGEAWIAHSMTLKSHKYETQTELTVDKVEFDADISDRLFTTTRLQHRGR